MATHELKVTANGDFAGTLGFDSETGQFSFPCGMARFAFRLPDTRTRSPIGAMAIGDTFEFDAVAAFDWAQFAVSVGLPRPLVASEMRKLADAVLVNIEPEPKALYEKDDLEYLEGVTALIRRRAQKMLVDSKEVPKVDKALFE